MLVAAELPAVVRFDTTYPAVLCPTVPGSPWTEHKLDWSMDANGFPLEDALIDCITSTGVMPAVASVPDPLHKEG